MVEEVFPQLQPEVTSYADVWVEIFCAVELRFPVLVTSYADVWVEIGTAKEISLVTGVTSYADV